MKPELKAMVEAGNCRYHPDDKLHAALEASLHWRENELWAGPVQFGGVTGWKRSYRWFTCARGAYSPPIGLSEARAALWAAAREQINKWFKEQMT